MNLTDEQVAALATIADERIERDRLDRELGKLIDETPRGGTIRVEPATFWRLVIGLELEWTGSQSDPVADVWSPAGHRLLKVHGEGDRP